MMRVGKMVKAAHAPETVFGHAADGGHPGVHDRGRGTVIGCGVSGRIRSYQWATFGQNGRWADAAAPQAVFGHTIILVGQWSAADSTIMGDIATYRHPSFMAQFFKPQKKSTSPNVLNLR